MLWNQWYFIYFACMKDKNVAAILAFFLGGLGVHRFYLNQIGLGFVYLIFSCTGIPALIAVIDFIVYLAMSEERFNKIYNKGRQFQIIPKPSGNSTAHEIEKLYELKERGIISEAEFQSKKNKLL